MSSEELIFPLSLFLYFSPTHSSQFYFEIFQSRLQSVPNLYQCLLVLINSLPPLATCPEEAVHACHRLHHVHYRTVCSPTQPSKSAKSALSKDHQLWWKHGCLPPKLLSDKGAWGTTSPYPTLTDSSFCGYSNWWDTVVTFIDSIYSPAGIHNRWVTVVTFIDNTSTPDYNIFGIWRWDVLCATTSGLLRNQHS